MKLRYFLVALTILLLVAVLGLIGFYKVKDLETEALTSETRKEATGKFIQLTAGLTHYEIAGPDSAQTIVLVHGFSVPAYIWDSTYIDLVRRGFRVIRYDEFGRGFSDRPDSVYSPSFYRKQLYELIQKLNLKTPVSLAGLSFGGAVIADFVIHYPNLVDKLVFIDPVYRFENPNAPEFVLDYIFTINAAKQATGQLVDFKYPQQFPNWVENYKVQMKYDGFRHSLVSTLRNYSTDTILRNYDKLRSLDKKILLIWGREDQTVPFIYSDSLRARVPCEFLPVMDAGHLPHLESSKAVNTRIFSFLNE